MFKVIAVAPKDGWAYVKTSNEIYLVNPHYITARYAIEEESAIQESIDKLGYEPEDKEFANWFEVMDYLKEKVAKHRKCSCEFETEDTTGSDPPPSE